jgi:hypothetical protein
LAPSLPKYILSCAVHFICKCSVLFSYTFLTSHWNRRPAVVNVKPHYFNCITLKAVWFDDWEVIPTIYFMQRLRFSQWGCWGFRLLGTCRRVSSSEQCCPWSLIAEAEGATGLQNVGSCVPKHSIISQKTCIAPVQPYESGQVILLIVSFVQSARGKNTLHGDCLCLYNSDFVLVPSLWEVFFFLNSVLENCSEFVGQLWIWSIFVSNAHLFISSIAGTFFSCKHPSSGSP